MDNIHSGKIEEVIYHGDHTRVRINLLGNNQFILKVPNSSANLILSLAKISRLAGIVKMLER